MTTGQSLTRLFFLIIILFIFSFPVNAQQIFQFKNKFLWELSCADFDKAGFRTGNVLSKKDKIN